jgi:putative lipoic acid-binding regulatory protein
VPLALPSVLQDPILQQEADEEHREQQSVHTATNLYHRLHWALSEKKTFDAAIKELDKSNGILFRIIRIQSLDDPTFLLADPITDMKAKQELYKVLLHLKGLHTLLCSVNPSSKPNHVGISIQLLAEYTSNKDKLSALYNELKLKNNSYVFYLQAHKAEESCSYLLLAEMSQLASQAAEGIQAIESLKTQIELINPDIESDETFKLIGHVSIPGSSSGQLRLFQNIRTSFKNPRTLIGLLEDQSLSSRSHASWHAKVGFQVAIAYAQFVSIKVFPYSYPRPANYRYYEPSGRPRPLIDNIPYLFWGFGSKPTPGDFDLDSRDPPGNAPAVELGLLLYQIGSWKVLEYVDSEGRVDLLSLGREARSSLQDVVLNTGLKYANIVQACFDTKNSENDWKILYQRVFSSLQQLYIELQH